MRKLGLLVAILVVLTSSGALAQSPTHYLSIPSSSFTPQTSEGGGDAGYNGNDSGTARFFAGSQVMFAPVNLPHDATVTSLRCGGRAPFTDLRIIFTLRRNEPQQENVDLATIMTTFQELDFQSVSTNSITSPVINNAAFNYYIVASLSDTAEISIPLCPSCSVGFCRIGYTINQ